MMLCGSGEAGHLQLGGDGGTQEWGWREGARMRMHSSERVCTSTLEFLDTQLAKFVLLRYFVIAVV
jgi:hypothetical protein